MYEQNNVEFTGVLVDRQYTTGQKYAQLVFETAEGIRLSLSRNIDMVRSLRLGLTYKVSGLERTVGQKSYIHGPTATLVSANKLSLISKRYKIFIPLAISLVVVLSGVGVLAYATHNTNTASQPVVHEEKPVSKSVSETALSTPTSPQPASNIASSTPAQPQAKTTPAKSVKKSTTPSSTPIVTNPVTNNTVTTPVANDATNPPASQEDTTTGTNPPATDAPGDAPLDGQTDPDPNVAP